MCPLCLSNVAAGVVAVAGSVSGAGVFALFVQGFAPTVARSVHQPSQPAKNQEKENGT
jgi:hypothetical protein